MFDPKLKIGDVLTESAVHDLFMCQVQFGIRLSKKNNAIVIVSKTYEESYHDHWEGDVL